MSTSTVDGEGTECFHRTSGWPLAAVVVALSTVAFGCAGQEGQTPGELTPEEEKAVADTVQSLTEELAARVEALEPEPYLQLFSDDIQFFYRGWSEGAQYEKEIRKATAGLREYPMEITDTKIEVLGRNGAVASLIYRSQPVDTAGQSSEVEMAWTLVFERRDGEWKVVQAHESLIPQEDSQ